MSEFHACAKWNLFEMQHMWVNHWVQLNSPLQRNLQTWPHEVSWGLFYLKNTLFINQSNLPLMGDYASVAK